MPELDKNYLAGLYLDEITLDVMPQAYIDAALEVKLRHDACAPRAGYVCVQDRRVKGGFYYRKAPQGQGVNALPPSKLERALARSQEQPRQRSEMGFLSKAAIGAGVAIGGLALTGAVINAGRSSEPYQEPPRRVQSPSTNNNAAKVGLGVAAATATTAATVLGRRGGSEAEVQSTKVQPEEVQPIVNQQVEEVPAKKREGAEEASYDIAAIKEMTSTPISLTAKRYETALAAKLMSRQGLDVPTSLAEAKEMAASSYGNPAQDETFVPISNMQSGKVTKASTLKASADLQQVYDKLKEYGLENSIEFRKTRSRAKGREGTELTSVSANPYVITRDGVQENIGEVRFTRSPKDIQQAIAEKIKNPTTKSQPSTESAKPKAEKPNPVEPPAPEVRTTSPEEVKQQAIGRLGQAIRIAAPSADGYVNQSSLLNDKVLKSRLAGNDPVDLIAEGIEEGRIQVKKTGKNTYIRDISVIPAKDFAAEALSLNDVKSKDGDRRVKDLREALEYKRNRATTDEEKQGIAELEAAIAGIQEVKPETRQPSDKSERRTKKEGRSETNKGNPESLNDAKKMGLVNEKPDSVGAQPISDEEAAIRTQRDLDERKAREESATRAATGIPTRPDNYISPIEQVKAEAKKLKALLEEDDSIDPKSFNAKVKSLRSGDAIKQYVELDSRIREINQEYADKIEEESLRLRTARIKDAPAIRQGIEEIEKDRKKALSIRRQEVYKELGIPDLIKGEKENSPASQDQSPTPEAPKAQPPAPASNPTGNPSAPPTDTDKQETTRSQAKSDVAASGQSSGLVASAERAIAEFDKKQKAAEKREKARKVYIEKLDKVVAGEWVKDPDSTDRYSSNARKKASDKDASLFISVQKEDDGWMVYTEEHEPEDIADVFSGDKAGKTRFFSLEQAKEAAGEFAEYYESLVQENKTLYPEDYKSETPATPAAENPSANTKKRSSSSKSVNTATSTASLNTDREQAAKLTMSRIKAILEAQGITIPKGAKKDQLLDLLVPNSKGEQNNDAIAPSEAYLSAYWEIRNKYRRAS